MRSCILLCAISLIVLVIQFGAVYGQNLTEYTISVKDDGSAVWIIRQTGTNVTASPETLIEFQNKVASLVEAAENRTGRTMEADEDTMSITVSYITIEYRFEWTNFSSLEKAKMIVGDVFEVEDFFVKLHGYGTVYLTYPSQYAVDTVTPPPYAKNESLQVLLWLGATVFQAGEPRIVFREKSSSTGFLDILEQNAVPIAGLLFLISGFSLGFYMFRRNRRPKPEVAKMPEPLNPIGIESDEERTLRLLKSSGGSLHQSTIKDQCGFSRAKTSQLLTALEGRDMIKRYKKGREKIVVLVEQNKKGTGMT